MKGRAVLFSSAANGGSDNWQTPEKVLKAVRRIAPIALDPCSARSNPTKAAVYWYSKGLTHNWCIFAYSGIVFVNPPYSQVSTWIDKIISENQNPENRKIVEIVALVPARTDQPWFQRAISTAQLVTYVKGRLSFKGAINSAPFPSALFYFGPRPSRAFCCLATLGSSNRLSTPAGRNRPCRPLLPGNVRLHKKKPLSAYYCQCTL